MSKDTVYHVALELVSGIGHRGIRQLIGYCGSAQQVFETPKSKLLKIPGFGEKLATTIKSTNSIKEAERVIEDAQHIGAEILHYGSPGYPQLLKQIPDAPNLLFKKGQGDLSPTRSIAIVGTRKATTYGRQVTEQIIESISKLNVTVISGLAFGIDIHAHKECLKNNVPTLAILAGGLDRIYPSEHRKYTEKMLENGAILTESFPGTKPDRHLFPLRNRIIAGMADATIVVEAGEKGGALITAHLADSYHRTVFAVPGNIRNTYSIGCNHLISQQKALIYSKVDDLIYHLGWDLDPHDNTENVLPDLSDDEIKIYDLLNKQGSALEIDLIAIQSGISINKVASILLSLEFKNLVKSMPGKKFGLAEYR